MTIAASCSASKYLASTTHTAGASATTLPFVRNPLSDQGDNNGTIFYYLLERNGGDVPVGPLSWLPKLPSRNSSSYCEFAIIHIAHLGNNQAGNIFRLRHYLRLTTHCRIATQQTVILTVTCKNERPPFALLRIANYVNSSELTELGLACPRLTSRTAVDQHSRVLRGVIR